MKRTIYLAGVPLLLSLAGLCLFAQARTAHTHHASFAGTASRPRAAGKVTFAGQVGDTLPGYLTLALDYDPNGAVGGGHWTLVVTERKADGGSSEVGRLEGTISGGSVTSDQDGKVISVNAARLTVKSGRGTYDRVADGGGTFTAAPVSGKPAPYEGSLTLTF